MEIVELLKVILLGIVQGITEWLPISSTGHMILLNEFVHLNVTPALWEVFLVVVQLGSILAVVVLYWSRLIPFKVRGGFEIEMDKISMWLKILVASIPAGVVGILWDDKLNELFYNYPSVAAMLIIFGVLFLVVEHYNKGKRPRVNDISGITYKAALFIGMFQLIAAAFPGTSRSGSTIIAALLIGISRTTAAEFTFFLAIPAMFGGSAIKLLKYGLDFTGTEIVILLIGTVVAFAVSVVVIKFLMSYIKKHDFKVFGWYRIALGALLLGYYFTR